MISFTGVVVMIVSLHSNITLPKTLTQKEKKYFKQIMTEKVGGRV